MSLIHATASLIAVALGAGAIIDNASSASVDTAAFTSNSSKSAELLSLNSLGHARVTDKSLDAATDILLEARQAIKTEERRKKMQPGIQERVVEKESTKEKRQSRTQSGSDKVLIMGGSEVIPM